MAKKSNKMADAAKKRPKLAAAIAVILVLIVVAAVIFCIVRHDLVHKYVGLFDHTWGDWIVVREADCGDGSRERKCLYCDADESEIIKGSGNHVLGEDGICAVCGFNGNSAELSVHFLELGNKYTGDCTLIKCGDTEVLIDAGSRKNSAATIKSYVDEYCTDGKLEYVIATHAHQDHIAGFVGNKEGDSRTGILYQYEVGTLIQFAGHKSETAIYDEYCDAVEYARGKGTAVYTAKECRQQTDGAKYKYYLDEAQTVELTILDSHFYYNATDDENDYSVCVLLTQKSGGETYNYLFTGDLEKEGESYLVEMNDLPQVDLFKGGHHGSYTASTEKLLEVIKPKNVAVCCCCGTTEYTTNAENTFPAQAFIDRVSKHTENIYCTTLIVDYKNGLYESMNGNIVFYAKNGELIADCSNNNVILKDTEWFKKNRKWKA